MSMSAPQPLVEYTMVATCRHAFGDHLADPCSSVMACHQGDVFVTPETRVLQTEDRGAITVAVRDFAKGEVVFQEHALAMVYPSHDPPWLAALRAELKILSEACAWQYCLALHCLLEVELPRPPVQGLEPMTEVDRANLMSLCGSEAHGETEEVPQLATITATALLVASREAAPGMLWPAGAPTEARGDVESVVLAWLARRIEDIAIRVSRNGFQVVDLQQRPPTSADGLFHRISFFNHCCAGLSNCSWTWNGAQRLNTVKTTREVRAGEEMTISYIAKPWCDMAKPARRRYLKQNFNFVCLCQACTQPISAQAEADGVAERKRSGKLGTLLERWLKEDREVMAMDASAAQDDVADGSRLLAPPEKAKGPLSDEERVRRVQQRCHNEGMQATEEEIRAVLQGEGGHVGRTMIQLRKARKTQDSGINTQVTDSVAGREAPSGSRFGSVGPVFRACTRSVLFASIAMAAVFLGSRLLTSRRK